MKKTIGLLCIGLLLFGCTSKKETKTCVINNDGYEFTFSATASKDNVEKANLQLKVPYETIGVEKEDFTDEMKAEWLDSVKNIIEVDDNVSKSSGITADYSRKDAVIYKVSVTDIKDEVTLQEFVERMESYGFDCK